MTGPAAHVSVTRSVEDPESRVWIRRGAGVAAAIVVLGVLAWQRSGLALVGVAMVAVVALIVFAPPTVQGFKNAVAASRDGRWVSSTLDVAFDGAPPRRAVIVIDGDGITVVDGRDYRGHRRTFVAWDAVDHIDIDGPAFRPHRMRVTGAFDRFDAAGSLGGDLLDRMAQLGAHISTG